MFISPAHIIKGLCSLRAPPTAVTNTLLRILVAKMAVNHDQKVEVVRRNIAFIQQSIAAGGLATVAGYLLQFELITRQNHDDALATLGRGPSDQAAMLMRTVELKIRSNPDLYFPRFTQALRWSNLGNVADLLEQQALPDQQRVPGRPAYTRKCSHPKSLHGLTRVN